MTTFKTPTPTPVDALLPHRGPLRLVDTLLDYDAERVRVGLTVRDVPPFGDGGGTVPAYIGLEYMAQAISVFSGLELHSAGAVPKIGLLIGTRRYRATVAQFSHGASLVVNALRVLGGDEALWVFDCAITTADGVVLALAEVKAFRPRDIGDFLDAA